MEERLASPGGVRREEGLAERAGNPRGELVPKRIPPGSFG